MSGYLKMTKFAVDRPVTTIVVVLSVIFFGLQSYSKMGLELMPNADVPVVTVTTVLVGANPEVIDRDVTDVLEEQLNTISGIKNITSKSYEGQSIIIIEFELERDIDDAAADVRAKVNLAQYYLPDSCEEPIISKYDIGSQAVLTIAVSGGRDYRTRAAFVDDVLKPRLQTLSGVGAVDLVGFRDREIRIRLKPDRLEAYGLTASDVAQALQIEHLEMPGGRIENSLREQSIRVEGEYASAEALGRLVVKEQGNARVRLRDVADVLDGLEEGRTESFLDSHPVITLKVKKQQGENEVAVCGRAKDELARAMINAPKGVEATVVSDTSGFIQRSLDGVTSDLMLGVLLTAMLMFFFLKSLRVTVVAVVSIPTSLIATFMILSAAGITINNLTMLAMSLAVGMVIDNTIVVIENIFRHLESGRSIREAALEGSGEVAFAVMAGTATTLAVFVPVATMKGVVGRFFVCFGVTIVTTMIISLLVSLTLTPFMAANLMRSGQNNGRLYRLFDAPMKFLERFYARVLALAIRFKLFTILIALGTFIAGILMAATLGTNFTPEEDTSELNISFELPIGVSKHESRRLTLELSKLIEAQPETDHVLAGYGSGEGGEINKGSIFITMVPRSDRQVSAADFRQRLRGLFAGYKDITFSFTEGEGRAQGACEQTIQAESLGDLAGITEKMVEDLRKNPGLADVDSDLALTKPMVRITLNRDMMDTLGVNARSIATEINTYFGGLDAADFKEDNNRFDINLRADAADRTQAEDIKRLSVRTADGHSVRLGALINVETIEGPNVIKRYNRRYAATVYANVTTDYSEGEGNRDIEKAFEKHSPSEGNMAIAVSGEAHVMMESFQYLIEALVIALIMVYVVMAIQFESFLHPLTIMFSLPLAFSGVFGLCILFGQTINIMTFIGMILLVGIVVNNAILLVDFANRLKAQGMDTVQAMLKAGPLRLRPIIMTAASTMISSLPIALALSEGSESRQPMSLAVIGGMLTSTLLTLVVIPVGYILMEKLSEKLRHLRLRITGTQPTEIHPAVPAIER